MARSGVALLVAGVTWTTACSLLVDTSGLSLSRPSDGGAPSAASAEGGSPNSPAGDGSASAEVDSGSERFCASPTPQGVRFCEDFDGAAYDPETYQFTISPGGAAASLDPVALSPPHALLTTYPANQPQVGIFGQTATFSFTFPVTLHFGVAIRLSTPTGHAEIGGFTSGGYSIFAAVVDGVFTVVEAVPTGSGTDMAYPTTESSVHPTANGWNVVDLYVAVSASGAQPSFGLKVDGADAIARTSSDGRATNEVDGKVQVAFGVSAGHTGPAWEARFDNLVFRTE
jgi:hypothetical protein